MYIGCYQFRHQEDLGPGEVIRAGLSLGHHKTLGKLKRLPSRLTPVPARVAMPPRAEAEADRSRVRDRVHEWRAWYRTPRWQALRRKVLLRDGYVCRQTGVPLIGKYPAPDSPTVDHIKPHRGDPALFWDEANLQAVSKEWHDREKQRQEHAAARQRR